MLFNSLDFWLFLPLVWVVWWWAREAKARQWVLLLSSYVFYGAWDVRFLGLIVLSTLVDYLVARNMPEEDHRRRYWLAISVVVNLGVLGLFKYVGFFVAEARALFQIDSGDWALDWILPVGISFYTFQTLGYTLDVYHRRIQPENSLLTFATFVAFFPQLMAGPIERAKDLIPQLNTTRQPDLGGGFRLFLLGMVKKVVLSGTLAAYAEPLYMNAELRGAGVAWLMGLLMFLNVMLDFSGYSDMAVGLGKMFGVQLSQNFNRVLQSQGFPDFWRRWHITLGRWFKDYALPALPFNRSLNYFVTFVLIGLWHGADWSYIAWGALMGLMFLLEIRTQWSARIVAGLPWSWQVPTRATVTLVVVLWTCQLFPAHSLSDGWALMRSMIGWGPEQPLPFTPPPVAVWLALIGTLAVERFAHVFSAPDNAHLRTLRDAVFVPWAILLCLEGLNATQEFVYFQF